MKICDSFRKILSRVKSAAFNMAESEPASSVSQKDGDDCIVRPFY